MRFTSMQRKVLFPAVGLAAPARHRTPSAA
jgi:hypothetical protein